MPVKFTYVELQVGTEVGRLKYTVSDDTLNYYLLAVEDRNPWYRKESPFGGPIVPYGVAESDVFKIIAWYLKMKSSLHTHQEFEYHHPIKVGDVLTTVAKVAEKYTRKDRDYLVIDTETMAQDGRLIMRGRTRWLIV
jgi:acyl dehydratase